jgi:prepilin-type N-terminal cleavage/methylation domain-containing protein
MRATSHTRGLTLVEMLTVIAIFTVVSLALSDIIANLYKTNAYTLEQAYEVNHARRGVERTVRDMREMTYGEDGAYPLVTMATGTVSFYSDIDRDESVELVRYTLTGTTLYKYVYNATGTPLTYNTAAPDETYTISEYVRNAEQGTTTFRYLLDDGQSSTSTTRITDIRYIEVQAIVNVDPNRNPGEFTLRSSATPRNLKTAF